MKFSASRRAPSVPSGHLSEAIAASLSFKTNAALRATLKGSVTVEVPKPCNALMVKRLHQLGHTHIRDDQRLIPEFDRSYSPFRDYKLSKGRGPRWRTWRNLMVLAINAGLDQGLFGLEPRENWWPGGVPDSQRCESYTFYFTVDGELPAVASVDAAPGSELSLSVLVNPKNYGLQPLWYHGLNTADACAHGWLERHLGVWIQDAVKLHCRQTLQRRLMELDVQPKGYSDVGSFFV